MCMLFMYVADDCSDNEYKIIIANNRDVSWDRPTQSAAFWEDNEHCIGGRDKKPGREGGTWLGASKSGKIGIVLNILEHYDPNQKGRGHLITEYLTSRLDGKEFLRHEVVPYSVDWHKFHFILIDLGLKTSQINYFNNSEFHEETLQQGIYVFDNSPREKPLKKSLSGKLIFKEIIQKHGRKSSEETLADELFTMLSDRTTNEDDEHLASHCEKLKFAKSFEKQLSATFVFYPTDRTGTRTQTILLIDKYNNCDFIEKTMKTPVDPDKIEWEMRLYHFKMEI